MGLNFPLKRRWASFNLKIIFSILHLKRALLYILLSISLLFLRHICIVIWDKTVNKLQFIQIWLKVFVDGESKLFGAWFPVHLGSSFFALIQMDSVYFASCSLKL
jgi:hypothetical protein